MDYLIAFSVYGLASLFPNYKYFYSGILITNFLRFASHTIGGVIVWGNNMVGFHYIQCAIYDCNNDSRNDRCANFSRASAFKQEKQRNYKDLPI